MDPISFEQQRLLNQPNNNQRISNIRLQKELQFLKKSNLNYEIANLKQLNKNSETNDTSKQIKKSLQRQLLDNKIYQVEDISYRICINKLLQHPLTLFIPKNYPFQEPSFYYSQYNQIANSQNTSWQKHSQSFLKQINYQLSKSEKISQIIFWLPKYKILQLVELIAIKIKQKNKQQTIMKKYAIDKVFDIFNNQKIIFVVAILIRILVGLGSYSGKGDWPNLGDFQAHRNWMSITVNKPIQQWYLQPTQNIWWRIDYPPVAAYLSYIFGSVMKHIQPQSMGLYRGHESETLTTFMRLSVIIVQVLFLFPPIFLLCSYIHSCSQKYLSKKYLLFTLFSLMIKPDIILIDHGHFQYNSFILGLILSSFYCLLNRNTYLCCLFFTVAIHSKQMSVYYALAFFAGLVGVTLNDYRMNKVKIISQLMKFGVIVVSVSLVLWLPFIITNSAGLVIEAIFPVHRGLYQLKVQNFWCISDVIMKWQNRFSKQVLMVLCFIISTFLSIPSMISMIFQSNKKVLTLGFFSISMTFFMFSYHVHEKSILLPLLMAPFLVTYLGPNFIYNLILAAIVGMYHLLKQDNQWLQYFVLMSLYIIFMQSYNSLTCQMNQFILEPSYSKTNIQLLHQKLFPYNINIFSFKLQYLFYIVIAILHISQLTIKPPNNLEYLHHLLFAFYSFCFNLYSLVLVNCILIQTIFNKFKKTTEKKT